MGFCFVKKKNHQSACWKVEKWQMHINLSEECIKYYAQYYEQYTFLSFFWCISSSSLVMDNFFFCKSDITCLHNHILRQLHCYILTLVILSLVLH